MIFAFYCESNGIDGRSAQSKSKHRGGGGDLADFNAGADERSEKGFWGMLMLPDGRGTCIMTRAGANQPVLYVMSK